MGSETEEDKEEEVEEEEEAVAAGATGLGCVFFASKEASLEGLRAGAAMVGGLEVVVVVGTAGAVVAVGVTVVLGRLDTMVEVVAEVVEVEMEEDDGGTIVETAAVVSSAFRFLGLTVATTGRSGEVENDSSSKSTRCCCCCCCCCSFCSFSCISRRHCASIAVSFASVVGLIIKRRSKSGRCARGVRLSGEKAHSL